jgi:hypothetical protein
MDNLITSSADEMADLTNFGKTELDRFIQESSESICRTGSGIGAALKQYRDKLFFKPEFETFEDYCQERWGFTSKSARTMIKNFEVRSNVLKYINKLTETGLVEPNGSTSTMLPVVESHYAALSTAASEYQGELWLKLNSELAEGEQLTAQKIRDEALKYTMAKKPKNEGRPRGEGSLGRATSAQKDNQAPQPPANNTPAPQDNTDDDQDQSAPEPLEPNTTPPIIKTFGDFDTYEPVEGDGDTQEPPESLPDVEPSQDLPATPSTQVHGRSIRITKLPAPIKPFGMAFVSKKYSKENAFNLLDGCVGQLRPGGRIAYFCTLIEAFDAIRSAEPLEDVLKFEHFIIRQVEPGPETPDTVVFPVATQAILLFKFEPKGTIAPAANTGNLIGLTNLWRMELKDATYTLLDAFVTPGDRVFCPTGGNDFIGESINWGCEVEYLCDEAKAEHYRSMFGG